MELEFLKNRYDSELERRDKLTESLALPAGVLTALGGAIGLMAHNFSYTNPAINDFFRWTLAADVLAFGVCLYFLAGAYHGQEYEYLPRLADLQTAQRELLEWYEQIDGRGDRARADFEARLRERIIQAADRNALSNDIRTGYLYWSRVMLFMVLVLAAVSGMAYVADAAFSPKRVPTVRIENLVDLKN